MNLTRRTILASIPACGLASIVPAGAEPVDPLLDAINAYKAGWQRFLQAPDEDAEMLMDVWRAPHRVLRAWDHGCATREGACAALRLAIDEDEIGDSPLTQPLMRAALSFLNGSTGS